MLTDEEKRKVERLRRKETRESDSLIVARAFIWFDFISLECPVPELVEKVTRELKEAVEAGRHLAWRHRRERIEEG